MKLDPSITTKRRSRRAQVYMSGELLVGRVTLKVTIRDISAQGALIVSDYPLDEGCEIELKRGALSARGRLAWVHGRQAGIRFDRAVSAHVLEMGLPRELARKLDMEGPAS